MEKEEDAIILNNKYVARFTTWLARDKLNYVVVAVLIFGILIRLYYFNLVGEQPLWWDEMAYGSLAKNYVMHQWDSTQLIIGETLIRPQLLPLLWALLLLFNLPEIYARFILEFIPSVLSVFFVYLIGKEVFNKRVGIISAFIMSVLWIHLFYTLRLLTDVMAMSFLFASIYYFIKAAKQELNYKYFSISIVLLSISTLTRYPYGMFFGVYFIMLIVTKNLKLNNKKFWIYGLIGLIPMALFFGYNYVNYGNIFPAFLGSSYVKVGGHAGTSAPFAYYITNFIATFLSPGTQTESFEASNIFLGFLKSVFSLLSIAFSNPLKSIFLISFLIGLAIILSELVIGFNFITKNQKLQNRLLLLLVLAAIYSFFIFYIRGSDDRWLLPTSLSICIFAGFGLDFLYKIIKKYQKLIALILLLAILFFGAQQQLKYADELIKLKATSYLQMKQGFEWMKSNTPEGSVIVGNAIQPYVVYYAERQYMDLPSNESESDKILGADYLVIHWFIEQPQYIFQYIQNSSDKWEPLNAFFLDEQKQQPGFIVFKKSG